MMPLDVKQVLVQEIQRLSEVINSEEASLDILRKQAFLALILQLVDGNTLDWRPHEQMIEAKSRVVARAKARLRKVQELLRTIDQPRYQAQVAEMVAKVEQAMRGE